MPLASIAAARDAMLTIFKTAWDGQTPPVPLVIYDDTTQEVPSGDTPWCRVTIRHNISGRATVGGEVGARRFRRVGVLTVQIFTPTGEGLSNADIFAKVALDAFEGNSTGSDAIEFRNVTVNEVGRDGPWYQTNVLTEFEYDEVK